MLCTSMWNIFRLNCYYWNLRGYVHTQGRKIYRRAVNDFETRGLYDNILLAIFVFDWDFSIILFSTLLAKVAWHIAICWV